MSWEVVRDGGGRGEGSKFSDGGGGWFVGERSGGWVGEGFNVPSLCAAVVSEGEKDDGEQ